MVAQNKGNNTIIATLTSKRFIQGPRVNGCHIAKIDASRPLGTVILRLKIEQFGPA